eukprot:6617388-Pyramimonas_sp.AAC.1
MRADAAGRLRSARAWPRGGRGLLGGSRRRALKGWLPGGPGGWAAEARPAMPVNLRGESHTCILSLG